MHPWSEHCDNQCMQLSTGLKNRSNILKHVLTVSIGDSDAMSQPRGCKLDISAHVVYGIPTR